MDDVATRCEGIVDGEFVDRFLAAQVSNVRFFIVVFRSAKVAGFESFCGDKGDTYFLHDVQQHAVIKCRFLLRWLPASENYGPNSDRRDFTPPRSAAKTRGHRVIENHLTIEGQSTMDKNFR